MTKEEVKALIKAKIEGQGSAIDAASVLPAILNGILDLIDGGGGGGTSDAVQYVPQTLTETQQMQARKNQGLYRTEVIPGGEIVWDGDATGKDSFVDWRSNTVYCKIADGPLDISGRTLIITEEGYDPVTVTPLDWRLGDGPGNRGALYINEDTITLFDNYSPYAGDYNIVSGIPPFTGIFATSKVRKIEIQDKEETVLVEPKYLTNCIVIPFTKDASGNVTCDLSIEELEDIIFNVQGRSTVCPAINGVLGIPGFSIYHDTSDDSESIVFAFQSFGSAQGRLSVDDGGDEPKILSSNSAFNLGYTLLFVYENGDVREENDFSVPLWGIRSA